MVVAVAGLASVPAPALAHGIGGRADLPVPVSYFAAGAGIAIVVSFVLLSALWTAPRLQEMTERAVTSAPWVRLTASVLRLVGLVGLATVAIAGLFDGSVGPLNVAPVLVFVYFWLVVPFLAALVGDLWRWMSPWGTLSRWINRRRPERGDLVARLGIWPATVALLSFTWLELVYVDAGNPRALGVAALVYAAIVLVTGWFAGPASGLRLADAFHTYNGLFGAIAPVALVPDGAGTAKVVHRGWLRGLPSFPEWPGLASFVVTMIGTVTYDGLSGTELWADLVGDLRREMWFGTLALIGSVVVIGAAYLAACVVAARLGRASRSHRGAAGRDPTASLVARRFAHTLVPIALAYAVAHYLTLVLFEGQLLFAAVSDPLGRGWDLFGTADRAVTFWLSPEVVWYLQVAAIVGGHVLGVVLAHDRALTDFGGDVAVRTQYAMLALMVALTSLGLFVLAG